MSQAAEGVPNKPRMLAATDSIKDRRPARGGSTSASRSAAATGDDNRNRAPPTTNRAKNRSRSRPWLQRGVHP